MQMAFVGVSPQHVFPQGSPSLAQCQPLVAQQEAMGITVCCWHPGGRRGGRWGGTTGAMVTVKLDPVPGCGKPVARATGASWEARGRPAPGKGKTVGPGGNWLCASMRDCAAHGLGTSPSGSVLQAQETHQGWRGAQGAGRYQAKPPNILGGGRVDGTPVGVLLAASQGWLQCCVQNTCAKQVLG